MKKNTSLAERNTRTARNSSMFSNKHTYLPRDTRGEVHKRFTFCIISKTVSQNLNFQQTNLGSYVTRSPFCNANGYILRRCCWTTCLLCKTLAEAETEHLGHRTPRQFPQDCLARLEIQLQSHRKR